MIMILNSGVIGQVCHSLTHGTTPQSHSHDFTVDSSDVRFLGMCLAVMNRFFWLRSKLSECDIDRVSDNNEYRFAPVPFTPATMDGLKLCYHSWKENVHGFPQDGLMFINRKTQ